MNKGNTNSNTEHSSRRFVFISAGSTALTALPSLVSQAHSAGETADGIVCDYDTNDLAIAKRAGFTIIEWEYAGAYAQKQIRAALDELGWDSSGPIEEPRNNPRKLRPVVMANASKLKAVLEAWVRKMGEGGLRQLVIAIVYSRCGPTASTTALTIASEIPEWTKEWKATYPLLRIRTYVFELAPVEYTQGNGNPSNGQTGYFSAINATALADRGTIEHLVRVNGADYWPARADDLTLSLLSRWVAVGVSTLLGQKITEAKEDARSLDALELLDMLPRQSSATFIQLGYPEVHQLRRLKTAGEAISEDRPLTIEDESAIRETCQELDLDAAPLDEWQVRQPIAIVPRWLPPAAIGGMVAGIAASYWFSPWPWQPVLSAASVFLTGIIAGTVIYLKWRKKRKVRRAALDLLMEAFGKFLTRCRAPRVVPPTFRPGFTGSVNDLLEKPLSELLKAEEIEFYKARVKDFVSELVPAGARVVHVITVTDPTLKAFGFSAADVAKMTGSRIASGWSNDAKGLTYVARYIILFGPVKVEETRGWEPYRVLGGSADGDSERYNAFHKNEEWQQVHDRVPEFEKLQEVHDARH